ncbi:hypothetical protein [Paenibacillus sp. FJAT-27812]|uniref:hypothetical protein n=1 Tax=Paenibacillus sp. FJAT-27812 TaxID=1684143 RepID=UPI0006A76B07|nr:hypothetical protein [Paenibacillus sp. FJAT-27812]
MERVVITVAEFTGSAYEDFNDPSAVDIDKVLEDLNDSLSIERYSVEEAIKEYLDVVRFSHDRYVEATRWHADVIINGSQSTNYGEGQPDAA